MSLTGHLDDPESPIRQHFEGAYPHIAQVRFADTGAPPSTITIGGQARPLTTLARFDPGQPKVLPTFPQEGERGYDWGAAGSAFDYRVRLLLSPQDPAGFVAAAGARNLARRWRKLSPGTAWSELAAAIVDVQQAEPKVGGADAGSASRGVARLRGLLALYEQLYRSPPEYLADHPLVLAAPTSASSSSSTSSTRDSSTTLRPWPLCSPTASLSSQAATTRWCPTRPSTAAATLAARTRTSSSMAPCSSSRP